MASFTTLKRGAAVALTCLTLGSCVSTQSSSSGSCSFRGGEALGIFRPGAATVAVTGDVLLHRLIQSDAARRPDHFAPAFQPVAPFLRRADLAVVNLEGPAARNVLPGGRDAGGDPPSRFDDRIYGGYPAFNYHPSITEALAGIGVDLVQTANNHALDRGPLGVERTLEALQAAGLPATGTVPRGQVGPWHQTVSLPMSGGAARVAFLACTYGVNGLPDPHRQALRCYGDAPSVPGLIADLRSRSDIDAVVLLPHWGQEYTATPDARQRRLARAAIEAGAAAVIGTHPHVLQPIEQIAASDGRTGFVAYSLGNFISSQWALPRRTGAVLYFDLQRDGQGRVVALPPRALPTRVDRYQGRGVTVLPASFTSNGSASVAHARQVLGGGAIIAPSDLGFADDGSGCL
jgi:poly-gamma-glutamate synthesis protein (capsule biosynthesis protein)